MSLKETIKNNVKAVSYNEKSVTVLCNSSSVLTEVHKAVMLNKASLGYFTTMRKESSKATITYNFDDSRSAICFVANMDDLKTGWKNILRQYITDIKIPSANKDNVKFFCVSSLTGEAVATILKRTMPYFGYGFSNCFKGSNWSDFRFKFDTKSIADGYLTVIRGFVFDGNDPFLPSVLNDSTLERSKSIGSREVDPSTGLFVREGIQKKEIHDVISSEKNKSENIQSEENHKEEVEKDSDQSIKTDKGKKTAIISIAVIVFVLLIVLKRR